MEKINDKISFEDPKIIVIFYLVIGCIWILFSDALLSTFVSDMPTLVILQSFKGIVFISFTSIVIFYLINRAFNKIKSSQKLINENERKNKIILDTVGDVILYADKYGKIIDINKRVESKLGYSKKELLGKSFIDVGIIDIRYILTLAKMFRQGINNNSEVKIELELRHKNGTKILVEANNKFIMHNGEVLGAVTAFRDITERKNALIQIENNIQHFAHLVDHIRNPLATINTYTQLRIDDPEIQKNLITQIERIEDIIKQLDEGWMNTEETRKFLNSYRHY